MITDTLVSTCCAEYIQNNNMETRSNFILRCEFTSLSSIHDEVFFENSWSIKFVNFFSQKQSIADVWEGLIYASHSSLYTSSAFIILSWYWLRIVQLLMLPKISVKLSKSMKNIHTKPKKWIMPTDAFQIGGKKEFYKWMKFWPKMTRNSPKIKTGLVLDFSWSKYSRKQI